jgi:NitT/TauT family transport system permease protein
MSKTLPAPGAADVHVLSAAELLEAGEAERQAKERSQRATRNKWNVLAPMVTFALFIGLWYFVSYARMNANRRRVALPGPHDVLTEGFLTWSNYKQILTAMLVSGRVALIGLVASTIIGIGVAVLMNSAKWAERSIFPYAVVIQTLPILALVPLFNIWFSSGVFPRVLTCILIAVFPVITNTLFGLKSSEQAHHDLFTLHKASRMRRLVRLELPAALPAIFTGLRIAAGGSVIGAIVGDFFFRKGDLGIGRLIDNYAKQVRMPELIAAAATASMLGISIFMLFGWISNRVLRSWHESVKGKM